MKYTLEVTEDSDQIKAIMCNERLFKASMPDEDIKLFKLNKWEPAKDCTYLVYKRDGKALAIVRLYPYTNLTVDMHVHLHPGEWGKNTGKKLERDVEKWLIDNTEYCKISIRIPQSCDKVLKAAVREDYELEGVLTAAICWRGQIENVILMSKFIRGLNNG